MDSSPMDSSPMASSPMASSPASTKDSAFNPSLRSLGSTIDDSQTAYNDRARDYPVKPFRCSDTPQLFPHTSLVSRRATFTSIDSFWKQGAQFGSDQAQMQMLKRNFKSILSFMRSRTDSDETDRKKSKFEGKAGAQGAQFRNEQAQRQMLKRNLKSLLSVIRSRTNSEESDRKKSRFQSADSAETELDHNDNCSEDSDIIPWFGANEATILAGRAAASAPKEQKEAETEADDSTEVASDDYVAFQSSIKRRRILSMFDRQEKIVASAALDSFDSDALEVNLDGLYELFALLEATSTTPPSLKRRINGRRAKFGISRSTRSMFKRL